MASQRGLEGRARLGAGDREWQIGKEDLVVDQFLDVALALLDRSAVGVRHQVFDRMEVG